MVRRAVVVGLEYSNEQRVKPTASWADVTAYSEMLVLSRGYLRENIRIIKDDNNLLVKPLTIVKTISEVFAESQEGDVISIFISGHALTRFKDGVEEKCLYLGNGGVITGSEFTKMLTLMLQRVRVNVALDVCGADGLVGELPQGTDDGSRGIILFTACRGDEQARVLTTDRGPMGGFTYFLTEAVNSNNNISNKELFDKIVTDMDQFTKEQNARLKAEKEEKQRLNEKVGGDSFVNENPQHVGMRCTTAMDHLEYAD